MDSSPRRTIVLDFCEREIGNVVDRYAVAAKNDSRITVGHLPRKISRICSIFLMGGGNGYCHWTTKITRATKLCVT